MRSAMAAESVGCALGSGTIGSIEELLTDGRAERRPAVAMAVAMA